MKKQNILLTGLPRSGSTMLCHLLNKVPNTIALNEPIPFSSWANQPFPFPSVMENKIKQFFLDNRMHLLQSGTAGSRQVNGKVPSNNMEEKSSFSFSHLNPKYWLTKGENRNKLRKSEASRGIVKFDKELTEDFILCVKHNSSFTALISNLSNLYPCFATIRNPLAVLASWNSIRFPPQRGHIPGGERLDPGLASALASLKDKIDRQLHILNWFFDKYNRYLKQNQIIRYEDVITSRGKIISTIHPQAKLLNEALINKNVNKLYNTKLTIALGERLLKEDGVIWEFYTKKEVESLMNDYIKKQ